MTRTDNRWAALVVLCTGMLMIVLDATVVNVALPAIQEDLGFSQASLAWVVNAYLIAFGGLLLLAGRIGDLTSKRGVFVAGLAVFTAASVLCGLATSSWVLVAARFVQGVGGAMTSAVILGMIVTMFPEPREQAKAIGMYAFVASAGGSIGLLAGGVLTQAVNWHWIFFINIPIGIATVVAARRYIPVDRGVGLANGTDVQGAVLITSSLMLGVYTIVEPAAHYGWTDPVTVRLAVLAVLLMAGFIAREATASTPLIPLRIFRNRTIVGANIVQAVCVAGMFGMFFLGVLYLQQVLGYDALGTGLAFLPCTIVMGGLSMRYAEPLIMKFGARNVLIPGLALVAVGLGAFAATPVDGTYLVNVLPSALLMGAGSGIAFPALMTLAMSAASPEEAGLASGLANTTMEIGAAVGLAVLATLSATKTASMTDVSQAEALTAGYRLGFVVAAGLIVAAVVVAATVLPGRKAAPQAEPALHGELALAEA